MLADGASIRRKAQRDYQRAARQLNRARAESERFHTQDKPLYARWLNAEFGGLLTELRDLQGKLFEAQTLVAEVQQEYHFGEHASIGSAYRKVLHRRAHPELYEEDSASEEASGKKESEAAGAEDPFQEIWERFEKLHSGEPFPSTDGSAAASRLKDLYRKLARRLHPDNGHEITSREKELWHQTQSAYGDGQVEVLETILAMLEVDEQGAKSATVSTLLQLTAGLKLSLRTLKRELSALRRDMAWDFSRRTDHSDLLHATERTLHGDREKLLWLLAKYQGQIQKWDVQMRTSGKRVRAQRGNWMDEEWF